jgi:NAD(P)-dependent dehydrogenase (short-subunit alcohol dehydrogenase family)
MRPRGGGTIINIGSVLSDRAVQLQSAYSASKHAIAGFSEALRLELQQDDAGIDVVLIQPSSINTPFFTWARSRFGVKPQPIPPVYEPSAVAEVIAHAAEHGGREIVVGGAGKMLSVGQWLSPSLVDRYLLQGERGFRQQLTDKPDDQVDNLFEPSVGPGRTTGDFEGSTRPDSVYTRVFELHPILKRLGLAAGLAMATAGVWRLGRS